MTNQTTFQRAEANLLFNVILQNQHLPQAAILERMKEVSAQMKAIMPQAREWVSYAALEARGGSTNIESYQRGAVYNLEAGVLDDYQADFVAKMSFYSKKELRFLTTKQRHFLEKCASVSAPEPVKAADPVVTPLTCAAAANAACAQVMRNAHALAKQYRQARPDATYAQLLREALRTAWSESKATKELRVDEPVSLRLAA